MPKNYLYTVLIVLAILLTVIFLGYLYYSTDQMINTNDSQVNNNNLNQTNTNDMGVPMGRIGQFEQAASQDNKEQMKQFLADKVELIIYATECCGLVDKDVAMDNFDYIDQAGKFDFAANQTIARQIKEQNPDLQNYFIGIADNGTVLAYQVTENSKINKVYLVVDYNLIIESEENNNDSEDQPICRDLCGDGICQEIVCLGSGCPCAETPENCPEDCQ